MPHQREVLYVWDWQKLRVDLDFTTEKMAYVSLTRLNDYALLGEFDFELDSKLNRWYRTTNMLAATHMGLRGSKHLASHCVSRISATRESHSYQLAKCKLGGKHIYQTEEHRLEDLRKAHAEEPEAFRAVFASLMKRLNLRMKKKGTNDSQELVDYIKLMERCSE